MGMALVGMELFGYRIRFDKTTGLPSEDLKDGIPPILNFDNFINAFVTVFVLTTKQEWNLLLYNHLKFFGKGHIQSYIYLISVVVVGNFIIMRLFLAVLINNFSLSRMHEKVKTELKKK
jgi:hypothetical protein